MKVCPSCSTTNPSENNFCGQCGTRLPTSPAASALDQPSSVMPATAAQIPSQSNGEAQRTIQPETSSDLPDWLRDLDSSVQPARTAVTSEPSADLPDWLQAVAAPEDEQPTSSEPVTVTSQDLPPWLLEDVPDAPSARSDAGAIPATQEASSGTDLPPQLDQDMPAPEATASGTSAIDQALPSWLIDQDATRESLPDQAAATTGQERDMPNPPPWLVDAQSTPSAAKVSSATPEVPSRPVEDVQETSEVARTKTPLAATQELPAWLLEDTPAPTAAPQAGTSSAVTQELPSWLLEDEPSVPDSTARTSDDILSSWPQDETQLEQQVQSASPDNVGTPTDDALPSWLQEEATTNTTTGGASIYEAPSPKDAASASSSEQQTPLLTATNSDLPPWLTDTDTTPTDSTLVELTLPAWLGEPEQPSTPEPKQQALEKDVELPAWLREEFPQQLAAPSTQTTDQTETGTSPNDSTLPAASAVAVQPVKQHPPAQTSVAQPPTTLNQEPSGDENPGPAQGRKRRIYLLVALLIIGILILLWLAPRFGLG